MESQECNQCPITNAMKILGGKWKMPILQRLMGGYLRFSELLNNIPFISSKVLSGQLKEMQKDGLVERVQHNEVPLRVEYSLTKDAIQLKKILEDLSSWEKKMRSKGS